MPDLPRHARRRTRRTTRCLRPTARPQLYDKWLAWHDLKLPEALRPTRTLARPAQRRSAAAARCQRAGHLPNYLAAARTSRLD